MYSKTCPIPVKNVRDKLIEMTPLSSLLSDCLTFSTQNHLILTYFTHLDTTHFFYKYYNINCERDKKIKMNYIQ